MSVQECLASYLTAVYLVKEVLLPQLIAVHLLHSLSKTSEESP